MTQLSGPSGCGKTQLALQLAAYSVDIYQTWYLSSDAAVHCYSQRLAQIAYQFHTISNNDNSNGAHHGDCNYNVAGLIPDPEPLMTDSVRREAARILAHPESVEAEVHSTLKQLRKRYVELQQRLEERSVGSNANHSAVSVEDEMIAVHVLQGGLKNERDCVNNS